MKTTAIAALTFFAFAGAAASANDKDVFTFKFDRSMLQTSDGADLAAKRIRSFANNKCGVNTERELMLIRAAKLCAADVSRQIVTQIDHPRLTRAFNDSEVYAGR